MKKLLCLFAWLFLATGVFAGEACRVLVVVGMEDERAIAAGAGVDVVVGSANATLLQERLKNTDVSGINAIFSFGVAGGLDPALKPGDLLVSSRVLAQSIGENKQVIEEAWVSDPTLLMAITLQKTKNKAVVFRKAVFLGTDLEARDNPETGNQELRQITGADIIDNESHIAARFASELNLPFVSIRAVSDSVNKTLPPAALLALGADGSPDGWAIAKSLLTNPMQIPSLIRTAWEYNKALRALKLYREEIGFTKPAGSLPCR